jgi:hypothetical protein
MIRLFVLFQTLLAVKPLMTRQVFDVWENLEACRRSTVTSPRPVR